MVKYKISDMRKFKFVLSVLVSSLILFVVSCANANTLFSKADHAKKRANNVVNVIYDVDGGSQLEKTVYDFSLGTYPQNIPTPQRAGYLFDGWYTKKNGGGELYNEDFVIVDSITVYAKWTFNTTPFTIILDYSKAQQDGVTITNISNVPSRATVAYNNTSITIPYPKPVISQNSTRDFDGYYDANGVKVCNKIGTLIPNAGNYTDSDGKWILDLLQENISVTLYPRWIVNIKATSVSLDKSNYYVGIDDVFTIIGNYSPANANTTLEITDFSNSPISGFGDIAEIQSLECNNGRFTIRAKGLALGTNTSYIKCIYNNNRAAINLSVGYINQIDPEGTITTVDLPLLTSSTITIPFDPPTANHNFSVAFTSTSTTYPRMLGYSIQDDKLTLTSLGESEYSGAKLVLGSIGLKITDSISGKTKNITVRIVPVESTVIPITPIPTVTSTNYDYETTISSEKPFQIYSLNLQKGKGYQFFDISSKPSYFRFFNSSCSNITYKSSSISRNQYVYLPSSTGTYYMSVATAGPNQTDTTVRFYVWEFDPITELSLSESSITLQSGQSTTLQLTYSPTTSPVNFSISDNYRITNTVKTSNTLTIDTLVPGVSTIYVSDTYSNKSVSCVVTVTWDTSKNIALPPITNTAASSDINDYTEFSLISTQKVFVYEIQLESGKKYHFLNVDSLHAGTGNADDCQSRIDCYFYLKNTNFDYLNSADDSDLTYICRESGTYYYIVTGYGFGNTGRGAFYIWAEDTP